MIGDVGVTQTLLSPGQVLSKCDSGADCGAAQEKSSCQSPAAGAARCVGIQRDFEPYVRFFVLARTAVKRESGRDDTNDTGRHGPHARARLRTPTPVQVCTRQCTLLAHAPCACLRVL
eukprot:6174559-Pleurochrysis_carterae.AAC.1